MNEMLVTMLVYTVIGVVGIVVAGVAMLCGYSLEYKEDTENGKA